LQQRWPEGRGAREFVRVLRLYSEFPAALLAQAVEQALAYGRADVAGIRLCLQALQDPAPPLPTVDLSAHPNLAAVALQEPDLQQYEQLLSGGER